MKKIFLKFKEEKGLTGADVTIGLAILMIMVSLLTAFFININNSTSEIRRNAAATKIITSIFEKIEYLYYDDDALKNTDVEDEKLGFGEADARDTDNYIELNKLSEENNARRKNIGVKIPNGYTVKIKIEQALPSDNFISNLNGISKTEIENLNVAKKVTVSVSYTIKKRTEKIEMTMIKGREVISMPNKPTYDEELYVPVKYLGENWIITTADDDDWYNYANGDWPRVIGKSVIEEENRVGRAITADEIYGYIDASGNQIEGREILVWLPRYAYNANERELYFLIGNSNKYVKMSNTESNFSYGVASNELDVEKTHIINDNTRDKIRVPTYFSGENSTGFWFNYTSSVNIEDNEDKQETKIYNLFHGENSILWNDPNDDPDEKVSEINNRANESGTDKKYLLEIKPLRKYFQSVSEDGSGDYNF